MAISVASALDAQGLPVFNVFGVDLPNPNGFAAINALNERLREDFTADCNRGLIRWNKVLANHGIEKELYLPHHAFNREIGAFADHWTAPDGSPLNEEEWLGARDDWLPTMEDRMFVASLMQPCVEPGKISSWIAPPQRGINGCPADYDYVRF